MDWARFFVSRSLRVKFISLGLLSIPDKNHQAEIIDVNFRSFCSIFNGTNIIESESDVAVLN
jgi:hypothetical protein|tara:strand:+ start:1350 stop:1535 length:186 start_codon:yes stop_codon:yes gene_type:complete